VDGGEDGAAAAGQVAQKVDQVQRGGAVQARGGLCRGRVCRVFVCVCVSARHPGNGPVQAGGGLCKRACVHMCVCVCVCVCVCMCVFVVGAKAHQFYIVQSSQVPIMLARVAPLQAAESLYY